MAALVAARVAAAATSFRSRARGVALPNPAPERFTFETDTSMFDTNRKRRFLVSFRRFMQLACTMIPCTALADTRYWFHFNNSLTDKNASAYGWNAAIGASATVDGSTGSSDGAQVSLSQGNTSVPPVAGQSSSSGFLFALPISENMPGVMMLYTTQVGSTQSFQTPQWQWFRAGSQALNTVTVGDIQEISAYTNAATVSGSTFRFAIRAGGQWHVSATSFTQTEAVWQQKVLMLADELWYSGVFTPGTTLDADLSDNTAISLDPSLVVSGYGWYADTEQLSGPAARIRLDEYSVKLVAGDPYQSWLSGFAGITPELAGREADADGDGIANVIEFVTGSAPNSGTSPEPMRASLPEGGSVVEFTYRRTVASAAETVVVQLSPDLSAGSWTPAVAGENGVLILTEPDGESASMVTVQVPLSLGRRFARLVVEQQQPQP